MKVLAFSDLHCDLDACRKLVLAGENADLVISAGDFAQHHQGLQETMDALNPLASKAIYVPGNNETADALRAATTATVLHGESVTIEGRSLYGIGCAIPPLPPLPWVSFDMEEDQAQTLLSNASKADILISHSPPKGYVDEHADAGSIGSESVLRAIKRLSPELVLCGHIHDCWGKRAKIDVSQIANLGPTVNWFDL